MDNSKRTLSSLGEVLKGFKKVEEDKYISREFQKYGYDLAMEMEDPKGIPLYIKLAKDTPRGLIETARGFVKDAPNVKSKTKLFMWKLKKLRDEAKNKK
jgi:hypothetical protein